MVYSTDAASIARPDVLQEVMVHDTEAEAETEVEAQYAARVTVSPRQQDEELIDN